ncbi:polyprenyl diphosphate synthase [Brevundimonas sp. 2R-24]|uniref:Isoprenyl transferase n=1 Tax=Peiella sedimenti TaxID=3061083 RepID=A0ABT8SMZ3_9CAUL|nr:polyprenyl diphosphate synthase [Caulobacteraceae bacterium XZ-24]
MASAPTAESDLTARDGGPRHVALIMDGNGRWAKARGLPRTAGHKAGVEALKRTVQGAGDLGVECLTVFGFSTENWRRPAEEVSELMGLVKAYVEADLERLRKGGVRLRILGAREDLSPDIRGIVERAESRTAHNDRFLLQVAFNYGGRSDIVRAARRFAEQVKAGTVEPEALTEERFGALLSTGEAPPLDMVVRTSGERRLSNFLLWEAAYAELVFQDILWPDYGPRALAAAIEEYRLRDRRFGALARPLAEASGA